MLALSRLASALLMAVTICAGSVISAERVRNSVLVIAIAAEASMPLPIASPMQK